METQINLMETQINLTETQINLMETQINLTETQIDLMETKINLTEAKIVSLRGTKQSSSAVGFSSPTFILQNCQMGTSDSTLTGGNGLKKRALFIECLCFS
jgi:hypothetical protein